jgi:hypothetical protein
LCQWVNPTTVELRIIQITRTNIQNWLAQPKFQAIEIWMCKFETKKYHNRWSIYWAQETVYWITGQFPELHGYLTAQHDVDQTKVWVITQRNEVKPS